MPGTSGREGGRSLKTRVKTARKRTLASTIWLERQLNDPYVAQARREGFRSRAAYKLQEMAEKYKLFRPGLRIVDLGAAPGGWAQIAAQGVKSAEGKGRVIGIDLLEIDPIEGVELRQMDFHDEGAPGALREWLNGPADGVMSDMAANATGHRKTDHLRIVGLAELAADFARGVLAPGGFFLAKVLQGGTEGVLLADLKRDFAVVRHVKPKASRADSAELYVLATGYRGRGDELSVPTRKFHRADDRRARQAQSQALVKATTGSSRPIGPSAASLAAKVGGPSAEPRLPVCAIAPKARACEAESRLRRGIIGRIAPGRKLRNAMRSSAAGTMSPMPTANWTPTLATSVADKSAGAQRERREAAMGERARAQRSADADEAMPTIICERISGGASSGVSVCMARYMPV